jgi:uncharacterized protein (DUF58 family)
MGPARGAIRFRRAAGLVAGGLGVVLVAFLFGAGPLIVPGVAFVLLGVLAPLWVLVLVRGAHVERKVDQDRVVEGEPLEAMVEVSGWLPGGELHDPLLPNPIRLPGGRQAAIRLLARFERRGRHHLPPPTLVLRDPLELAEGTRLSDSRTHDVLVLPRTERVRWGIRGSSGLESAGRRARANLLAAVEVDGLRPYRPGTPASRIHWPALARGAGLLERRLRIDGDQRPLVVLDARGADDETHLDAAVRAAASLTLDLARVGGCRLLLPGSRRPLVVEPDLVAWPAVHARLAFVEGGARARPPAVAGTRSALGALYYVAPRRIDRLAGVLDGYGLGGTPVVLVVPVALASGVRPSFAVAGCVGLPVVLGRERGVAA